MPLFHRLISARIGFSAALKKLASLALAAALLSSNAAAAPYAYVPDIVSDKLTVFDLGAGVAASRYAVPDGFGSAGVVGFMRGVVVRPGVIPDEIYITHHNTDELMTFNLPIGLGSVTDAPSADETHEPLHKQFAEYLRICGGRLPYNHSQVFSVITQSVVAAIVAHGLDTAAFADDVRAQGLPPPADHPVSWPWLLRIRLFDGFSIEGINSAAQDTNKKSESKSTQILQYLAAHAPANVAAQRLADALWPEAEGDKAMCTLDVALTRLRQALPDAALLVRTKARLVLI